MDKPTSPVAPEQVVAWLNPETGDCVSVKCKADWASAYGENAGSVYSVPLIAASPEAAPAAMEGAAVAWEYQNASGCKFLSQSDPAGWHPHDREGFQNFRALTYAAATPAAPSAGAKLDRAITFKGKDYLGTLYECLERAYVAGVEDQRAALAQPAPVQAETEEEDEPVAWFAFGDSNGPVPLELYGWDRKACLHAVLTNARSTGWKGTVNGYLLEKGWNVRPVYLRARTAPVQQDAPAPSMVGDAKAIPSDGRGL